MKPLKIIDIARAVGGELNNPAIAEDYISGVSFDTRSIKKGMLFVPLKGARDGHEFLQTAINAGAVCVFSEQPTDLCAIYVDDAKKAMGDLAHYYIGLFPELKVIGITGSSGKTSTKDMVAAVLSQKYNVVKTIGNFNNDIGMPITIFDIDETTQVAVLEMGMNNRHEITRLSLIARPDIAIITNIGVAHIENLGSREEIFNAKSELFDGLKSSGIAILHGDDDFLPRHRDRGDVIYYGVSPLSSYAPQNAADNGLDGFSYDVMLKSGEKISVCVPSPGYHMLTNSLAAVACGEHLGLTPAQIVAGIAAYKPTGMRMDIRRAVCGARIIADCYNANPDSMKAALEVLSAENDTTIAILGDMRELGENSKAMHYEIGKAAVRLGIDIIVCIGEDAKHIYEGARYENRLGDTASQILHCGNKEEFFAMTNNLIAGGTTVLVKASRGMRFEEIVEHLEKI
ncbi:MAG: UDP-N-acetylmuramoyl-tripeptide--D-alanyl-D-alanine ligase [Defluviitaleaceae bacterium]|nr:UDP-N-acetylmuramoyl-tripeptide--D-alanyl-D-alanine ligase [Defluviitaleaceae bacterium]